MSQPHPLPPIETLRELLDHDEATGTLRWKVTLGRAKAGAVAGSKPRNRTYRVVGIEGRLWAEHRIVWALHHGTDPYPYEIDHNNRNPTDNRISNLRLATTASQNANRILPNRKPIDVVWPDGSRCVARGVAAAAWLTQMGYDAVKQRVRRNRLGLTQGPTRSGVELTRCDKM